ncbi:hypothetical protein SDC9_142471 [bioreactor metagenome]|uniref:Uncharacterized protein n=1 Tax=bioreactor metagenome TaxID=1076179 RepID=A0A645E0X0_9ZZZZ
MLFDYVFYLIIRYSHLDTQRFGLVASGNDTAVIVRQDNDRSVSQCRIKYSFARRVEIIAINQSIH